MVGTNVTLLEGAPRVIVREEPFASAEVEAALREAGVNVRTSCRAVSVARDGDVTVTMDDGSRPPAPSCWSPWAESRNTESLGLETIGLSGKPVEVGTTCAPRDTWLYVIGDANGRAPSRTWARTRRAPPPTRSSAAA